MATTHSPHGVRTKQSVRLRRVMLAIAAYGVSVSLLGIAHLLGLIATGPRSPAPP